MSNEVLRVHVGSGPHRWALRPLPCYPYSPSARARAIILLPPTSNPKHMRQTVLRTCIPLIAAIALAAGVAAADPKTPLGKWMKPNMGTPRAGENYPSLQKAFDFCA